MDCEQAKTLLTEYLFDELDPARRIELDLHLQTCDDCRRLLEQLRATTSLLREAVHRDAPVLTPARTQRILHAVAAARASKRSLFLRRIEPRYLGIAAGIGILAIAGAGILMPSLGTARRQAPRSANWLAKQLAADYEDANAPAAPGPVATAQRPTALAYDGGRGGGGDAMGLDDLSRHVPRSKVIPDASFSQSDRLEPRYDADASRSLAQSNTSRDGRMRGLAEGIAAQERPARESGVHGQQPADTQREHKLAAKPKTEDFVDVGGDVSGNANGMGADMYTMNGRGHLRLDDAPAETAQASKDRQNLSRFGVSGQPVAAGEPTNRIDAVEKADEKYEVSTVTGLVVSSLADAAAASGPQRRDRKSAEVPSPPTAASEPAAPLSTAGSVASAPPPAAKSVAGDQVRGHLRSRDKAETTAREAADLSQLRNEELKKKLGDSVKGVEEQESAARFVAPPVNPWVLTADDHLSTFSLDVDTASYTIARGYIQRGQRPPAAAVRAEEFINAFDYNYPAATDPQAHVFSVHAAAAPSPFAQPGQRLTLLKVGVQARIVGREGQKPANLVLVIDASGSMARPDRLPLVQFALEQLVDQLKPHDTVSIVTYGAGANLLLEATPASDKNAILNALRGIQPSGSTNLTEGLRLGYQIAHRTFNSARANQIVLCSDGVANVGLTDARDMLQQVDAYRAQGVGIITAGFGHGSYNDQVLEQLANKGDGQYVFIDSREQAREVFGQRMSTAMQVVARDARIQVDFNPALVRRYRLIGYENRDIADERFRDDTVRAAAVASGQSSTALYEIELQPGVDPAEARGKLGTVYVRYRDLDAGQIRETANPVPVSVIQQRTVDSDPRFFLAAGAATFAQVLRGSQHVRGVELSQVADVLDQVSQHLVLDQRVRELADLVRQASELSLSR